MSNRRKFSGEFKAKVALEALTGELTLFELASKYDVHPTVIAGWKRQGKEGMVSVFSGRDATRQKDAAADAGHVRQRGVNLGLFEVAIVQAALGGIWAGCASLSWVLSSAMASTCM